MLTYDGFLVAEAGHQGTALFDQDSAVGGGAETTRRGSAAGRTAAPAGRRCAGGDQDNICGGAAQTPQAGSGGGAGYPQNEDGGIRGPGGG